MSVLCVAIGSRLHDSSVYSTDSYLSLQGTGEKKGRKRYNIMYVCIHMYTSMHTTSVNELFRWSLTISPSADC